MEMIGGGPTEDSGGASGRLSPAGSRQDNGIWNSNSSDPLPPQPTADGGSYASGGYGSAVGPFATYPYQEQGQLHGVFQQEQQLLYQPQEGALGGPPVQQGGRPPPTVAAMRLELQQLLSPEDRQALQQISCRARASAAVAALGLGLFAMNILKRKNWRYPIAGASLIGLTFGPPLGFAGYMLLNYSKVQQMEERFREVQAKFEQQRRGYGLPVSVDYRAPPQYGPAPGMRYDDAAAELAGAAWGSRPFVETARGPPAEELLKE